MTEINNNFQPSNLETLLKNKTTGLNELVTAAIESLKNEKNTISCLINLLNKANSYDLKRVKKAKKVHVNNSSVGFLKNSVIPKTISDAFKLEGQSLPRPSISKIIFKYCEDNGLKYKNEEVLGSGGNKSRGLESGIILDQTLADLFKMKAGEKVKYKEIQQVLAPIYEEAGLTKVSSKKKKNDLNVQNEQEQHSVAPVTTPASTVAPTPTSTSVTNSLQSSTDNSLASNTESTPTVPVKKPRSTKPK
jgi:hypothetical protein